MQAKPVIEHLSEILRTRKSQNRDDSYVASLHRAGLNKILEKVGEEATEVIVAAKDAQRDAENKAALVHEVADLWFHSMVMLSELDLEAQAVLDELARRFEISGFEEKAQRGQ